MLKPSRIDPTPTTQQLVQHWAARYRTDLQRLSITTDPLILEQYITAAHPLGRLQTVERVKRSLHLYCELSAVNTISLFSISTNVINLTEARRLSKFVQQVYQEILAIYAQQTSSLTLSAPLPVEKMAETMEILLLRLQDQHNIAPDPRTIGFLTTQFHLTTQVILRYCSVHERAWLKPYFQFIEEQVCIPWQRICAAAQQHGLRSPLFQLVVTLLPLTQVIAKRVYRKAAERYPEHRSRRGLLSNPRIAASTLRDLNMFQGYLCLCLLEKSMAAIDSELLPLCQLVFPSIEIKWELVEGMLQLLVEEIHGVLSPEQWELIQPSTTLLTALFTRMDDTAFEQDPDDLDDLDSLEDLSGLEDLNGLGNLDQQRHELDFNGMSDLPETAVGSDFELGLELDFELGFEQNDGAIAPEIERAEDAEVRAAIAANMAQLKNTPIAEDMAMI